MSTGRHDRADLPLLAALERLRESVIVTDAEIDRPGPRIRYTNSAFLRMTGYTSDEVLGRSPRLLQGPETDRTTLDRLRRCLESGETFEGEATNYRKDGTPFLMRWYVEPIRDGHGAITHFFAVQRDATAERAREAQRLALEQAVGQLGDGVLIFGTNGRVRYANDAYQVWSKRDEGSILGRHVWTLPGVPERFSEMRWARHRLSRGLGWQREYPVKRRARTADHRFVFVTVSPIRDAENRVIEYVVVCRDVTEHRRLETIAEASNFHDHLGVVFSGIRHELGNPINSVKAALQVITSGFGTMDQERVRDYLERMTEEVGRVEYLLRSLRSYSLYDRPNLESVDLDPLLGRFHRLAVDDLERRGIRLTLTVEPDADFAWADPQALHQVLLNVIGNAGTALDGRPHGHIQLSAERQGDHVQLLIRDNGPGIPADQLPNVFKPFYTTRTGGTGLGLAISRRLLAFMRGTIEIASGAAGTSVRILLDRTKPGQATVGTPE